MSKTGLAMRKILKTKKPGGKTCQADQAFHPGWLRYYFFFLPAFFFLAAMFITSDQCYVCCSNWIQAHALELRNNPVVN